MICSYRKANPETHVPSPISHLPSSGADPTRKTACPGLVSEHSTLNFSMEDMARSSPRAVQRCTQRLENKPSGLK